MLWKLFLYIVSLQLSALAEIDKDEQYTQKANLIIDTLAECSTPEKRTEILKYRLKNEEDKHE